ACVQLLKATELRKFGLLDGIGELRFAPQNRWPFFVESQQISATLKQPGRRRRPRQVPWVEFAALFQGGNGFGELPFEDQGKAQAIGGCRKVVLEAQSLLE